MSYTFSAVETSPTKLKEYSRLLSAVFTETHKFTVDFLNWQYKDNPAGEVVGYDAYLGGELAAHYVTIPVIYFYKGQQKKGLLSLNTATGKAHQGKGLFTQLAEKTYELGKNLGYEFVIGVANQNSTHGFLKKLDFALIAPLDVKIGAGKINALNKSTDYIFLANHDDAFINWRLANPFSHYYKSNDLLLTDTGKYGVSAVLCHSVRFRNNSQIETKSSFLKTWIGIADHKKIGACYFNLPKKLKPSPLNLIFKSLNSETVIPRRDEIFFELIDFDAY